MDSDKLARTWNEQKIILRKRITDLTENNQLFSEERKAELMAKLGQKLGKSQEEIKKIIGEI